MVLPLLLLAPLTPDCETVQLNELPGTVLDNEMLVDLPAQMVWSEADATGIGLIVGATDVAEALQHPPAEL